jgi:hypothetical protein
MSRGTKVKTLCSPMSQQKIKCVFCLRIGLITRKKYLKILELYEMEVQQ